ncbi:MAG TPA: GtrA family protein [Reyranella sp.]|nr:GtrA family protein [Reyranella sp.]
MRSIPLQFLYYVGCSGCAALANLLVGSALIYGAGLTSRVQYPLAVGIGYCAGMAVNFTLNRRFTFEGSGRTRIEQGRTFLVVALSGLLLTSLIASVVRSLMFAAGNPLSPLMSVETIGQIAAIGAVAVYSFAGHRYLTFNRGIRFQLLRLLRLASAEQTER